MKQNNFTSIDQEIEEMEDRLLLMDNKELLFCVSFIVLFYIVYISWLTRFLLLSGRLG